MIDGGFGIGFKEVSGASLSPDGKWLALVSRESRTVEIWNASTGKKERSLEDQPQDGASCAWSPDGQFLATHESSPNQFCIWDMKAYKRIRTVEGSPDSWGENLCWSADGAIVISVDRHGTIRRWDYQASTELRTTKGPEPFDGAYSTDFTLLASAPTPGAATLWDVEKNRVLGVVAALPREQSIAISPEGHWRGTPRADQLIVYVVRTAKGQEVLTPKEFEDRYGWHNDPDKVRLTVP